MLVLLSASARRAQQNAQLLKRGPGPDLRQDPGGRMKGGEGESDQPFEVPQSAAPSRYSS